MWLPAWLMPESSRTRASRHLICMHACMHDWYLLLAEDLPFRAESLAQLTELTERAMRAEKKKTLAEKDLKDAL